MTVALKTDGLPARAHQAAAERIARSSGSR